MNLKICLNFELRQIFPSTSILSSTKVKNQSKRPSYDIQKNKVLHRIINS